MQKEGWQKEDRKSRKHDLTTENPRNQTHPLTSKLEKSIPHCRRTASRGATPLIQSLRTPTYSKHVSAWTRKRTGRCRRRPWPKTRL